MKSIKKTSIYLFVLLTFLALPAFAAAQTATAFNTLTFTRTHGRTNIYSQTLTVPGSYVAPFTLNMVNGKVSSEREGMERDRDGDRDGDRDRDDGMLEHHHHGPAIVDAVTSASVWIDGIEVMSPRDVSRRVHEMTLPLSLSPGEHHLEVRLNGKPGSFMTLTFMGIQVPDPPVLPPPDPPALPPPVLAPPVLQPPALAPPTL